MGRGGNGCEGTNEVAVAAPRQQRTLRDLTPEERAYADARHFIGRYEGRIAAKASDGTRTPEELFQAQARALGDMGAAEQRNLVRYIKAAESTGTPQGDELARRGRKILLLANHGFVEQRIARYAFHGVEADSLRQAARIGFGIAVDKYNFDKGANFLTFSQHWMRAEISKVLEAESSGVRIKSKAQLDRSRVQIIAKEIEAAGRHATLAQVVDRYREKYPNSVSTPETLAIVFDQLNTTTVSFDAPVNTDNGATDFGSLIADDSAAMEAETFSNADREAVQDAMNKIQDPFHRKVMELYHGLGGREEVAQKDMSAGHYVDADGNRFVTSKTTNQAYAQDPNTSVKPQGELDEMFREGAVTFEPTTPEARELMEFTGTPPTPGSVDYAIKRARATLSDELAWMSDDYRYRGVDELVNSEAACEEVRRALVDLGHCKNIQEARQLKAVDKKQGVKKGPLALAAEQYGLVDTQGRVRLDKVPAPTRRPTPTRTQVMRHAPAEDVSFEDIEALMLQS